MVACLAACWLALVSFCASAQPTLKPILTQQELDKLPERVRNMTLQEIVHLYASSPADGGNPIPALQDTELARLPASMMDLTLAEIVRLQRIIEDPTLEQRLQTWMQAYLQAAHDLPACIVERGGARNLLLAQLWCNMFKSESMLSDQARPQPCESAGWLEQAEAVRPWDRWMAWYAAGSCDAASSECDSDPEAMAALRQLEPDNAAVELLALAHTVGNDQRRYLHQAAQAGRYHNDNQDIVAALYHLSRELRLPDMEADVAAYVEYVLLGQGVTDASRAMNTNFMMMATIELQAAEHDILWLPVKQMCQPLATESGQRGLRRDCTEVASLLARGAQSFIVKKEALQSRVQWETDRRKRQHWQQQLRQFWWDEAQMQRQVNQGGASKSRFGELMLGQGLNAVMDDWRASASIAATPPANWQPADQDEQAMLRDDRPYPGDGPSLP